MQRNEELSRLLGLSARPGEQGGLPTAVAPGRAGEPGSFAGQESEESLAEEPALEEGPAPPDPRAMLAKARSLLTDLRPSGFGEVLVTDVWLPAQALPPSKAAAPVVAELPLPEGLEARAFARATAGQAAAEDRQVAWQRRHELRQLGLLRERPALSYDARTEEYWPKVRDAIPSAPQAILDPYTYFVAGFGDADPSRIPEHRFDAQEYGRNADALVALGRAYMVIGRLKGAQSAFRAAARQEPYHPEAWWHLGISHLFGRANDRAEKELRRAAEQSPGDLRPELALGVALYHQRRFEAAEEQLRRVSGSSGVRAAARSMLGCSLRMQGKWDEARVELSLLRHSTSPVYAALAGQCLDCVQRGEERRAQPVVRRQRATRMLKSLLAAGAGAGWVVYSLAEDLFRKQPKWAVGLLFALLLMLAQAVKGITGRESPGEFGNAEQGLPCWQATTWTRPRRAEL